LPKINKTKYAILGMLSFEPMSGYDMKKRFDNSIAHFWNENYGHIYPVLKRLEREGLVVKKIEHTEGKPVRNVYSITEKGRKELYGWLLLPAERPTLRIELLLKLFFGHEVPVENMIQKVESEKTVCEQTLLLFEQIERHIQNHKKEKAIRGAPYWLITLRFGKHYYGAILKWCEETLLTLKRVKEEKK